MFEIYRFSQPEILAFLLVLVRISTCFAAWPILGGDQVPAPVKVLVPVVLTLVIFPIVGWKQVSTAVVGAELIPMILKEAFIGLLLGFMARFFFLALSVLGELASLAVGLSMDQMVNPAVGGRTTVVEQLYVLLGSVVFLSLNGHHVLLSGLVQSYELLPLSVKSLSWLSMKDISLLLREVPIAGLKLAAPIIVAMFIINLSMGVVSRIVPQINILITSLSVNLLVGFFIMAISLPLVLNGMHGLIDDMLANIFRVMKAL